MSRSSHLRLMASYNEWMNARLYAAAATMPHAALALDRIDSGVTDLLALIPDEEHV